MYVQSTHQLHNFFIQRIRNNTNKRRTPAWLKKYGLVVNPDDAQGRTKWADRYLYVPELVQHGEDGQAYYFNPETDEFDAPTKPRFGAAASTPAPPVAHNELIEPDAYYEAPRRAHPADTLASDGGRSGTPLFPARARKLFGGGRAQPSHQSAPSENGHAAEPHAPAPVGAMDELDRELMGLSTEQLLPPVRRVKPESTERTSRIRPEATPPRRDSYAADSYQRDAAPAAAEPGRDVMDFEHAF